MDPNKKIKKFWPKINTTWTYLPNDFRSFGKTVSQWISDPQVFNRYSYCRNNPLKYTDPTGHGWFFKGLTAGALGLSLLFLCLAFVSVATGGLLAVFVLAYIAYAISATCFAYEWIYKGFKVITEVDTRDGEIISVKQKQNDKIIGGWQQGCFLALFIRI
jgi:hypothetical protein